MLPMFDLESQKQRGMMYRRIRDFFDGRGYLEIFTPTLSPTLIPEPTIQDFETRFVNEFVGDRDFYLIPSPEIFMKEVLACGSPSVYQISQCFRNSEQLGCIHNPEFTMLEYYTLGFDEKDSITLTRQLIDALLTDGCPSFMKEDFLVMSVNEAMIRWAGTDLEEHQDRRRLARRAEELGQSPAPDEAWDDIGAESGAGRGMGRHLQQDIHHLRRAGASQGPHRGAHRQETDVEVTKAYYEKEYARLVSQRAGTGLPIPDVSDRFPTIAVPPSSGVAIGLDRLLMCLTGSKDIRDVLLFPFDRLMRE